MYEDKDCKCFLEFVKIIKNYLFLSVYCVNERQKELYQTFPMYTITVIKIFKNV